MDRERFEHFSCLISGIYRCMQKLKAKEVENLGLKNVHIFWVYLLRHTPEGLTASELAQKSRITRALVSREITALTDKGYVSACEPAASPSGAKRRYGWRYVLTGRGMKIADEISAVAMRVQSAVDAGLTGEELAVFYKALNILSENFEAIVGKEVAYE